MPFLYLLGLYLVLSALILPFIVWHLLTRANNLEKRCDSLEKELVNLRYTSPEKPQPAAAAPLPEKSSPLPARPEPEAAPPPLPQKPPEPEPARVNPEDIPPTPEPSSFALAIDRLGLRPPGKDDPEANPVAWWCTRLGLALGVIAAVFFGQYVNQFTVPWVRLAQLSALSVGLFGLGVFLERKKEAYGRALEAGGLGLLFVAAYASYALPAMKVLADPGLAVAAQVLTLGFLAAWSWLKKSEPTFSLALGLGYLTTWFAMAENLVLFPLVSLFLLGLTGVAFLTLRGWWLSLWIAIGGSSAGLCWLSTLRWTADSSAGSWGLAVVFLLTVLWVAGIVFRTRNEQSSCAPAILASSAGLATGLWITLASGVELKTYYLTATLVMVGVGILAAFSERKKDAFPLRDLLWGKAAVLLSLYLIAQFEGPVRAFALLAQAAALLALARRTGWLLFDLGALAVALLGGFFLLRDGQTGYSQIWNLRELYRGLYLAGMALLTLLWMKDQPQKKGTVVGLAFLALGALWSLFLHHFITHPWAVVGSLAGTALFILLRRVHRASELWLGAVATTLGAALFLIIGSDDILLQATLWFAITLALAWWLDRARSQRAPHS